MVLSNEERGHLEKSIDREISSLSTTISLARVARYNTQWQLKNDEDFALGWALGSIICDFSHNITNTRQVDPSQEDMDEAVEIITKRIREIKESIFKCG